MRRERVGRALDHLVDVGIIERNPLEIAPFARCGVLEVRYARKFALLEVDLYRDEPVRLEARQPETARHRHVRHHRRCYRIILSAHRGACNHHCDGRSCHIHLIIILYLSSCVVKSRGDAEKRRDHALVESIPTRSLTPPSAATPKAKRPIPTAANIAPPPIMNSRLPVISMLQFLDYEPIRPEVEIAIVADRGAFRQNRLFLPTKLHAGRNKRRISRT